MWRDNMRLADMHIHTTFSPDGKSSMEEQCIKAIEIGIPIICFTDHVDFNSVHWKASIQYKESTSLR